MPFIDTNTLDKGLMIGSGNGAGRIFRVRFRAGDEQRARELYATTKDLL